MLRLFQVNQLAERKKLLLLQSDLHRRTLLVQLDTAQQSVAHLKKRFAILGASSLALSVGASLAGILFAKKQASQKGGGGIFSKLFSAVSLFNQVKGFFNKFRPTSAGPDSSL